MAGVAFVFAGQGAQYPGMGRDLYDKYPTAARLFDMLDDRLRSVVFDGPSEPLNRTENTQPALFAVDLACALLLREGGIKPDAVAGFSLGEIPAAAFAGLLDIPDAFELVKYRASVMSEAAAENPGVMLAVLRLDAGRVEEICAACDGAYAVNYNCPGQTVVACRADARGAVSAAVSSAGGRAVPLPVGGAFHSPYMRGAGDRLLGYLEKTRLSEPCVPLYSNVTAKPYGFPGTDGADDISVAARRLLARQVYSPVLWQRTVENMADDGIDTFVEVGAGRVLSGLIKKIVPEAEVMSVGDVGALGDALVSLRS